MTTTSLYDALAERELTIRSLNDAFRRSFTHEETYLSPAIEKLSNNKRYHIIEGVRLHRHFNRYSDPERLHNRGRFRYDGLDIIWEIHYFDRDLQNESSDPADIAQTKRYMMILLSSESWEDLPPPKLSFIIKKSCIFILCCSSSLSVRSDVPKRHKAYVPRLSVVSLFAW